MRVLFLVSDRALSSNAPGGSGLIYGGLLALLRARGDRVDIVLLKNASNLSRFEQWKRVDPLAAADLGSWVERIDTLDYEVSPPGNFVRRKITGLLDPQKRVYRFLDSDVCERMTRIVLKTKPDLVLAADLAAGLVATRLKPPVPVLYYHHDFFWRVKRMRETNTAGSWRRSWGGWLTRSAELRLVKNVDAVITGSLQEVKELQKTGVRYPTLIPPVVTPRPEPVPQQLAEPCRIVHLGGFATTATTLGLQRFLDIVWPAVRSRIPRTQFWVVGDTSTAPRKLLARLESMNVVVTGFVENLSSVLRPGDINVVPWDQNTGIRTRVVTCFQHRQVLVAVRAGVGGYEDLENRVHAHLVDRLEEMVDPLVKLATNPDRRLLLAKGGRGYLLEHLTIDAVLPRFDAVVHSVATTDGE